MEHAVESDSLCEAENGRHLNVGFFINIVNKSVLGVLETKHE